MPIIKGTKHKGLYIINNVGLGSIVKEDGTYYKVVQHVAYEARFYSAIKCTKNGKEFKFVDTLCMSGFDYGTTTIVGDDPTMTTEKGDLLIKRSKRLERWDRRYSCSYLGGIENKLKRIEKEIKKTLRKDLTS